MKRSVKPATVKADAVAAETKKVIETPVKKAEVPTVKKEILKETAKPATVAEEVAKPVAKAAAKPAAKKAAPIKESFVVQYAGRDITQAELIKKVKEDWTKSKKQKIKDIKSIEIYLVPEKACAYYVINGEGGEEYKVEL